MTEETIVPKEPPKTLGDNKHQIGLLERERAVLIKRDAHFKIQLRAAKEEDNTETIEILEKSIERNKARHDWIAKTIADLKQ